PTTLCLPLSRPSPRLLRPLHSFPTRRSSDLSLSAAILSTVLPLALPATATIVSWPTAARLMPNSRVASMFSHVALPRQGDMGEQDRKSTRLNFSHGSISYAVFCLKKKNNSST